MKKTALKIKISKYLTYFHKKVYSIFIMNYRVSRNLEYAFMALSYMSERPGNCVSAREMTQDLGCPFHPFSRVLQNLVDHKIIISKQGIRGGYLLNKNLEKLSLYQLMKAVLLPIEIADCLSGHCDLLERCNIKSPIHYLNRKFLDFYKALSVHEILDSNSYRSASFKKEEQTKTNKVLSV